MGNSMIKCYLFQKKNNKNLFDLYHVSGFFEFLMLIVSVNVSENVIIIIETKTRPKFSPIFFLSFG